MVCGLSNTVAPDTLTHTGAPRRRVARACMCPAQHGPFLGAVGASRRLSLSSVFAAGCTPCRRSLQRRSHWLAIGLTEQSLADAHDQRHVEICRIHDALPWQSTDSRSVVVPCAIGRPSRSTTTPPRFVLAA